MSSSVSTSAIMVLRSVMSWSVPICIEIDENLEGKYKVTRINLYGLRLKGKIPKEIGKLINLQNLNLHNNQLTGEIPKEIGKLMNLKYLYLNNNQLTGEIPKEIKQMKKYKDFKIF